METTVTRIVHSRVDVDVDPEKLIGAYTTEVRYHKPSEQFDLFQDASFVFGPASSGLIRYHSINQRDLDPSTTAAARIQLEVGSYPNYGDVARMLVREMDDNGKSSVACHIGGYDYDDLRRLELV